MASIARRIHSLFALAGLGLLACATATDELPIDSDVSGGSDGNGGGGAVGPSGSGTSGSTSAPNGGAPVVPGLGTSGSSSGGFPGGSGGGGSGSGGSGGEASNDLCPDDPDKTEPGQCGCGVPDLDSATVSSCVPLQNALIHRWSFEGNADDSVGNAHGTLMGGATLADGALTLAGAQSGQYLDLPNGIISKLSDATLEAWVTWNGTGGMWQRVFDFGSSSMPEGQAGAGNKYLFLSTMNFRMCYTSATPPSEIFGDSGKAFPVNTVAHVAVTVNSTSQQMYLYLNGESVAFAPLGLPRSAIDDVNNWLGRSQFAADDYFGGRISEFRIYDAALTSAQVKTSLKMGESSMFVAKP